MSIISIAIQKGGSGKTTTAINLAAALHQTGKSVLLIDADPQANLSQSLGLEAEPVCNLYTEIKQEISGEGGDLTKAILTVRDGLDVVPSSIDLAGVELELVSAYGREHVLDFLIKPVSDRYDFVFVDCPHAIGMLTVNALTASDSVIIPLQGEFLPLKGVQSFMRQFDIIKKKLNHRLTLLGLLLTRFDERKTMNVQVRKQLEEQFPDLVFKTTIRTNIQLAKAQEAGIDIFSFDKHAHGAEDYMNAARELIKKL